MDIVHVFFILVLINWGAVVQWSEALLFRENKRKPKDPRLAPRPRHQLNQCSNLSFSPYYPTPAPDTSLRSFLIREYFGKSFNHEHKNVTRVVRDPTSFHSVECHSKDERYIKSKEQLFSSLRCKHKNCRIESFS